MADAADEDLLLEGMPSAPEDVESQAKTLARRRIPPWAKVSLGAVLVAAILGACLFHGDKVSPSLPKAFIQLFNPAFGTGVKATDAALNAVESTEGRTFSYVTFELQSGAFGATQPQLVTHPMNQATDFKELVDAMPATEPRYAMVHMPNQMVFVHWSPDTAMATAKSMYMSSAKGIQDSLGSPVSLSILAKDKNELSQELEKISH